LAGGRIDACGERASGRVAAVRDLEAAAAAHPDAAVAMMQTREGEREERCDEKHMHELRLGQVRHLLPSLEADVL
jgi:hypothetical protein